MAPEGDYTAEELSELVRELPDGDLLRLKAAARTLRAKCNRPLDEILNEAILRALDGRRICPKRVNIVAFLFNVMRSVTSEWVDGTAVEQGPKDETRWGGSDPVEVEGLADARPNSEKLLLETERLRREQAIVDEVKKMFEDDERAWFVLEARLEGKMTPDEVCASIGIDRKTYETVQKRIRRGLIGIAARHGGNRP